MEDTFAYMIEQGYTSAFTARQVSRRYRNLVDSTIGRVCRYIPCKDVTNTILFRNKFALLVNDEYSESFAVFEPRKNYVNLLHSSFNNRRVDINIKLIILRANAETIDRCASLIRSSHGSGNALHNLDMRIHEVYDDPDTKITIILDVNTVREVFTRRSTEYVDSALQLYLRRVKYTIGKERYNKMF